MESMRPAAPALPPAAYLGGKRRLAGAIAALIETIPHRTYAEPFVGMGGVFFRRLVAAQSEVINDRSRDVANLFRILQRHYVQFMDTLRFGLTTRTEFERLIATDAETLTDLERAARFLYLQRATFGGKVTGRKFGVDAAAPARFDIAKLGPMLAEVHERLSGVVIECLAYREFIERYDSPQTLFYLDPPYWGHEADYGKGMFARTDFRRLATQLAAIDGAFVLSINDVPEVRQIYKDFAIRTVETTYTAGGMDKARRVSELLITGGAGLSFVDPTPNLFDGPDGS